MSHQLVFLVLGLGNGAVFAALALVLVVTYSSSGVVNFGAGAIALYVAYTFSYLQSGQLLDPIPGTPVAVSLGTGPLGLAPALAVALAVAALLGLLLYAAVFRPLRTASATAKAVASIGVMLVLQSLLAARVGTLPASVAPILPTNVWSLAGMNFQAATVWFAVIIVGLAVCIWLWYRFTRFGLATRAAASSEKGALVTGLSPDRIALANWVLGTMVAGLSGVLISTLAQLTPESYTLFIVPALAAALVGNFTSIPVAVAAGLVIGMVQSWCTYIQSIYSWLPQSGLGDLVPLIIILGFLLLRGQSLPSRGSLVRHNLGTAPRPRRTIAPGIVLAVVAVVALLLTSGSWRDAIIVSMIFAIIGISQVIVTGFTGQLSLAQLTLAGVGAFSLYVMQHNLHVPFPLAPIIAAAIAAVVGGIIGLPALRVRGLPVAIASLALAVAVEDIWFNNDQFNGGIGGAPINDPSIFGLSLGIGVGKSAPTFVFGAFCLVVMLIVAFFVARLRLSRLGASMLAIRANERSAAAAGINVSIVKIQAFVISGFVAGLGGCMLAYQQLVASAPSFDALSGIALFATCFLAGISSLSGGIFSGVIGGAGLTFLVFTVFLHLGSYYTVVTAVLLIPTVISYPEGMMGGIQAMTASLQSRLGWTSRKQPEVRPSGDDEGLSDVAPAPEHAASLGDTLLTAESVVVRFGGVVAVDDVGFQVKAGEILGLIGPNGAGKTTLIDAISGFVNATGSVSLEGTQVGDLKPYQRVRRGLGRTFQSIELYDDLTVRENIEVGTIAARGRAGHRPSLEELLRRMMLADLADRPAKELSQGERQLVSVARAMAGSPRVVLIDEPAAGLDSSGSRWLAERLQLIRDTGTAIVIVDHDMDLVLSVCDRVMVLDLGRVIAVGTPRQIQSNPAVIGAYLGSAHATIEEAS